MSKIPNPVLVWVVSAFAAPALWSCGPSAPEQPTSSAVESSNGSPATAAESGNSAEPSLPGGTGQGSAARDGVSSSAVLEPPREGGNSSNPAPPSSEPAGAEDDSTGERADPGEMAPPAEMPTAPVAEFPASAGTPTIYLASDSTVQTYGAAQAPQQGWGQRIAEFFTADVKFVNKAIGGRSSKSFIDEGRLDEIVSVLAPGDYLFAQWGINDRYRSDPTRFTDPATTFRQYLNQYIDAAHSKNAIPVLVTPTPRLDFSDGEFHNDFVDYCAAIKQVGADTGTRVIDLQTKGLAYYNSIGFDAVVADVSLPPMDVLHFQANGAFQMARLVAEGVKESDLPIAKFVK
jgi:lysophospholipase L1-like esterase